MLIHVGGAASRRAAGGAATGHPGVAVDVRVWPGHMHVFHLAAPMIPEATRSLRQIGCCIREATG